MTAPLIALSSRTKSSVRALPQRPSSRFSAAGARWFAARLQVAAGVAAAMLLAAATVPSAQAQTAQYTAAQINLGSGFGGPYGVAVDSQGDVFVADAFNNVVDEIVAVNGNIPASPTILTLGSGFNSPIGLAVDASGNVYVADAGNGAVKEILASNSSIITLGASTFNTPIGLALDSSGDLFVSDDGTGGVYEIVASGGVISATSTVNTLATGFGSPFGIAVDFHGNVFVADSSNSVVDELVAVNGVIPASVTPQPVGSGFNAPYGVATDASGDVYVTQAGDAGADEILAVNGVIPASSPTIVMLGSGFSVPVGVAVDANKNVYIADASNDTVTELVTSGANFGSVNVGSVSSTITFNFTFQTSGEISAPAVLTQGVPSLDFADAGTGSCTLNYGSQSFSAGDTCTVDVTFTPQLAGTRNGAIVLKNNQGKPIATAYTYGIGVGPQVAFAPGAQKSVVGSLSSPSGLAVDGSGSFFVADSANNRVLKETLSGGNYSQTVVGSGLSSPSGVALDAAGNLYIADTANGRVLEETPISGSYAQSTLVNGLISPQGVAVDPNGSVYIAEGSVLQESVTNGTLSQTTLNSQGLNVNWVAVDGNGNLFLVDTNASKVVRSTIAGQNPIPVGTGLSGPSGIAVDAPGNVFISDTQNNQVVKETAANGNYTQSVLQTGTLNGPSGIAVDGLGNVYVADADNKVFKEDYSDAPTVAFVTPTPDGTTDTTDGALSVVVTNIGNTSLTGGLTVPANFTLVSGSGTPSDCSTSLSLGAGTSCNLSFEFTPGASAAAGFLIGDAVLSDNNLNASPSATQTIILTGTAGSSVAASHFAVTSTQSTVTAGTSFSITVTAEDATNTLVSSYSGTIALSSTDAQLVGGGNVTLTNGTGTYTVTLGTAGIQTITATSTTGTAITGQLSETVQPGAAALDSIVAGSNQTTHINNAFATQLQLQVTDAFGNPVSGASVLFIAPGTGATAAFATPYNSNINQTVATTGTNGIATASLATANSTAGPYSVAASVVGSSIAPINFSLTNLAASQFLVTVLTDDAGTAANCPDQANGTGNNSNCSLRDAVAAVNALPSTVNSTITFASTLTSGGAQTLTLTNGVLTLNNGVIVTGPGATLLTLSGNGASQIFSIKGGVTTISGLTLTNASVANGGRGAAIYNDATLTFSSGVISNSTAQGFALGGAIYNDTNANLTVTNSTISGNTSAAGGGIYNGSNGTVTVSNSTINNNSVTNGGSGGGIFNGYSSSVANVTNSTIYGNSASQDGGGIHSAGTLNLINSTVYGNTVFGNGTYGGGVYVVDGTTVTVLNSVIAGNTTTTEYADLFPPSGFVLDPSNVAGVDPSPTSTITANLAPLANYGGTTQTMIPLPGSLALCGGAAANIPSGVTTDERGDPRTTTYGSTACVDAGAVQTNYSLIFVQQPTDVPVGANITPAPTVQLDESGTAFTAASGTIALTLTGNGTLTGGSSATTNGLATYASASIDTAGNGDTLTAGFTLNSTSNLSISTVSNSFDVIAGVSQLAFGTPPAANVTNGGNAGSAITVQEENASGTVITTGSDTITLQVSGPNGYFDVYTATAVNGVATFNLGSVALTVNGTYGYTAITGSLTAATASEVVSQASASTLSVVSGSGQSAAIGTAFSSALTVKVLSSSNTPVSGAAVTFTVPSNGPSANLLSYVVTSGADGTASTTATANGLASSTPYSVTATVSGNSANFSLTNTPTASSLTVTPSATGLVYGQPVTVKALISPAFVLSTTPTGTVTFYDGTTALTPTIAVAGASASDIIAVPVVGSHTYQAQYGGDANYSATSLKSAVSPVVVSKASSTLNGPAKQPVTFPAGSGGTTQVTLVGQYSGTGISLPGGTVLYTVNSVQETATITNGVATITIPASMPTGSYSIPVTYAGDGNYNAAPSITIPFSITAATATATTITLKASATSITEGTSVTLTATVAPTTGTTTPGGSVMFTSGGTTLGTATLNASGVATLAITTLPVGTDSITASYEGNNSFNASTSTAVAVTVTTSVVTKTATATKLTSSAASAVSGTAVVFTATVTPASPVPTGTVIFSDGTTDLNTATLNSSGVATYSTTSLTVGTHTITAAYSGNNTEDASTSSALTETITAAVTPQPGSFNITASPSALIVQQGKSGTITFTLTSVNGFDSPVSLTCSGGLPAETTCSSAAAVVPTAAGAKATVTFTTDVTSTSAQLHAEPAPGKPGSGSITALAGAGLAGLALLLGIPARKRLGRLYGMYALLMAMVLSGGLISMATGCGSVQETPTGSSTITITASGGTGTAAVTKTVTVTLTVTPQ